MSICWEGFKTFFKIGCFTLGGGYAMIPLMEDILVDKKGNGIKMRQNVKNYIVI